MEKELVEIFKRYCGKSVGGPKKLADKLQVSPSAISQIFKKKIKLPKDLGPKIAAELKIPLQRLENLLSPHGAPAAAADSWPKQGGAPVPDGICKFVQVVGIVDGEYFNCNFEEQYYPLEVLRIMATKGMNLKAIRVKGDALKQEAKDRDVLLVALDAPYEEGSLVCVKIKNRYTVKLVYFSGDKAILKLDGYSDVKIDRNKLQVVGAIPYVIVKKEPKKLG